MQSIRYAVGLRAMAAITTAAFVDAGLINDQDKRLVDHSKVKRTQEKVIKSLDHDFDDLCTKGGIDCIFFDGREDTTKVMMKADDSVPQRHQRRTLFRV